MMSPRPVPEVGMNSCGLLSVQLKDITLVEAQGNLSHSTNTPKTQTKTKKHSKSTTEGAKSVFSLASVANTEAKM